MKPNNIPLISILLAVKNEEKHLMESLDSIIDQSYPHWEVLLVDDHSSDLTRNIADEYADKYPNIRVIQNTGKGKVAAYNLAYECSFGAFFVFFAGDDVLPHQSLQERVTPLLDVVDDRPAVSLCRLKTFSDKPKFSGIVTPRNSEEGLYSGGTMMFNKAFAEKFFSIPACLGNEDLWAVLHAKYMDVSVYHVLSIGIYYRIHQGNSLSRMVPFDELNELFHKRYIAFGHFLEKYRMDLPADSRKKLAGIAAVETLRYSGSWLSILFAKDIDFEDRMRGVFHATVRLYWLRMRLFSLFSGWS